MIKSISFIKLTQFFHFNELKMLRLPGYFIFLKLQYKTILRTFLLIIYLFYFYDKLSLQKSSGPVVMFV